MYIRALHQESIIGIFFFILSLDTAHENWVVHALNTGHVLVQFSTSHLYDNGRNL
jgi:hypothetical protein